MTDPAPWSRIEELYYDALSVPEAERAAFLARACAEDDDVRREVESLLVARHEAGGFLSQPVFVRSLAGGTAHAALNIRLGSTIGQYQLLSVLGVGGMGEVFLAADTRLHRQVALKLLPPQFSQQPGRVRRFEQEARATTALNHPNIVTLYDTGQHEGSYFIVNEFVDGQTLRARLNEHGPLPVGEALNIAQQIATALAAAHAAGIVHRDIKPENVMLRRDGFVKVLDFGLAKLTGALPESQFEQDDTHDEGTPQAALLGVGLNPQSQTAAGALLGTIRYMSPEQARGVPVDARTDVFSLGVVLYEMLTGRTPFHRETATETLAAILEAEPAALPASIPAAVQRLIASALRKDSTQRLQTATEMATALRQLMEETQLSTRLAEIKSWRFWARQWWVWASVALLVGGMALVWRFSRAEFEPTLLSQLKFRLVESWKKEPEQAAIVLSSSPDGNWLAFAKVHNGQPDIFLKQVDGDAPRNLTNDVWNDYGPIWSPDGTGIAYISVRDERYEIWQAGYPGGEQRRLGVLPNHATWLTSWTRDGQRIFYESGENLFAFEIATGKSQPLTNLSSGYNDREFSVSADEQWIAYKEKIANRPQIFIRPFTGGTARQITFEGELNATPVWLPDGKRLLYRSLQNGIEQIFLAYLDGRPPLQLTNGHENVLPWEVTRDGQRVFYLTKAEDETDLYWFDLKTGIERQFSSALKEELFPAFSPDGKSLVYQQSNLQRRDSQQTIYKQPLSDGPPVRLSDAGFDAHWSPRGDQVAFLRQEGRDYFLWTVRADGTEARQLVKDKIGFSGHAPAPYGWSAPPNFSWSPDGSRLAFASVNGGIFNLIVVNADGTNATPVTNNADAALKFFSPIWSRDGKRLIFNGRRNVAGKSQCSIYLYDGNQPHILAQIEGNTRLLGWSDKETEFYVAVIQTFRVVDPVSVKLWRLSTNLANAPASAVEMFQLENTYWQNIVLSPNAKQLAYVTRQENAPNIWLYTLASGQRRRLTANHEPGVGLGSLTWSPHSDLLSYTKQSNTSSIWMIENFK